MSILKEKNLMKSDRTKYSWIEPMLTNLFYNVRYQ